MNTRREQVLAQLQGLMDAVIAGAEITETGFERGRGDSGGYSFNITIRQDEEVLNRAQLIKKARTGRLLDPSS